MASDGYIKLHRKMLEWGWYGDINTKILFLHCLLRANWRSGDWHGIHYEAGQFITSLETLANETTLSIQQVRTAIKHLISTGEITSYQQGKARIITVNNWCEYQEDNKEDNKEITRLQQDGNKVVTTDEESKERKKERNIKNIYPISFNEFWERYPRKKDKGQTYKCYQARLNDGYTEEQLLTACINYAAECEKEKKEQRYIKHGATFLSVNEPFVDYLDERRSENDTVARRTREDEEQRNAEIDNYLASDEFKHADDEMPFM